MGGGKTSAGKARTAAEKPTKAYQNFIGEIPTERGGCRGEEGGAPAPKTGNCRNNKWAAPPARRQNRLGEGMPRGGDAVCPGFAAAFLAVIAHTSFWIWRRSYAARAVGTFQGAATSP